METSCPFPVRSRETCATTLLNRDAVVVVTVPAAANTGRGDPDLSTQVSHIAVEAAGERYEGEVVVDMPPGHQRVADWLNAPGAFITVRSGAAHHLIQKRHVTRVMELDGRRG